MKKSTQFRTFWRSSKPWPHWKNGVIKMGFH